jgi:hypothetical protein
VRHIITNYVVGSEKKYLLPLLLVVRAPERKKGLDTTNNAANTRDGGKE